VAAASARTVTAAARETADGGAGVQQT
jgi:hypothetical protein